MSPAWRVACPAWRLNSGIGGRVASGQTVRLDDPLAATRFTAEEVEFWRDTGIYYFVPCVSKGSAVAALLLGRRESGEPLTTEDLNLVTAVAGQVAVAIENGRLYRQLHLKASELDRLRSFNENILESLDDGMMVLGLDDRIIRWNQALEQLYGPTRAEAMGQPIDRLFDPAVVSVLRAQRRDHPQGASAFRVPLTARHRTGNPDRLVNITTVPLQAISAGAPASGTIVIFEDITERTQLEEQLRISEKMASLGVLAAGVAHEVNTPLTGISSYTQMLLEGSDPADPRTAVLEKIEKQTFRAARIVNGLLHLSRSNAADASERTVVDVNAVVGDVLALLEHQFEKGSVKIRRELADGQRPGGRLRVQAPAGVPQPVPECARRHAERRLADDRHAPGRARGGGRGVRYRLRHRLGAPRPHLRSLLHHQAHRAGHGPGLVDHVWHRARARRLDSVPERPRSGHAVHAALQAGADQRATGSDVGVADCRRRSNRYAAERISPRHRR